MLLLELSPHLGQVSFGDSHVLVCLFMYLSSFHFVNSMLVKLDLWSINKYLFIRPSLSPILWMKIQADPVISLIT